MKTKTRGGRARLPKFHSPSSTTPSFPLLNRDEANGEHSKGSIAPETSSKKDDDCEVVASAYFGAETDIRVEKPGGLGLSEDCVDMDWLEGGTCLKCDRGGGNLLPCSQSGCPVALHENCTNGRPKFDDEGNFYCPYCWYKHEIMKTQELRKKAMKAKKALAHFLDFGRVGDDKEKENGGTDERKEINDRMDNDQVENQFMEMDQDQNDDRNNAKLAGPFDQFKLIPENQRDPSTRLSGLSENINICNGHEKNPGVESLVDSPSKEMLIEEKISKTHELETLADGETIQAEASGQVADSGQVKVVEEQLQKEPFNACCVEGENSVDVSLNISKKHMTDPVDLKQGRIEEEEKMDPGKLGTEMSDSDMETISMHKRRLRQSSKKLQSKNVDSPKKLSSPSSATLKKIDGPRNEKISGSKKSTQQVSAEKFTSFSFANEKRKRLLWTAEEEDMLREGVHKFSSKVNKNLPWRKVLEFGQHVFDPTRTPADLKDKWRNITAKESSGVNRR